MLCCLEIPSSCQLLILGEAEASILIGHPQMGLCRRVSLSSGLQEPLKRRRTLLLVLLLLLEFLQESLQLLLLLLLLPLLLRRRRRRWR